MFIIYSLLITFICNIISRYLTFDKYINKEEVKYYNINIILINIPIIGYIVNVLFSENKTILLNIKTLIIEIITLITYCYLITNYSIDLTLIFSLIFVSLLYISTISDINFMIVEDYFTGLLLLVSIIYRIIYPINNSYLYTFIPFFCIFTLLLVISILMKKKYNKDAFGGADIKIISILTLILALDGILILIFLASFSALIISLLFRYSKEKELAFVPFIYVSFIIVYLFKDNIISSYIELLNL